MSDLIGKELGPYRILEQIGSGGMATVYKAYHAAMDRYVAIKVLPEQTKPNAELPKRFTQETKVIARLEHTHILPVYDSGQAGNRLYLVMRYIEAGTLSDRLAAESMPLSQVNRILRQVGGALEYAHRLGVVHRDVKPSNVLLDAQEHCYLTDFGLARMMESSVRLTSTGVGLGTPAYMSPEQGKGEDADARSDIYSLGVMLYEMVTGQVPYQAETPMAVVLQHITAPLPLPSKVKPGVPRPVERVILKALAKNPDDRFQTVGEMVAAFDAAVRLVESEVPSRTTTPPAEKFPARLMAGLRKLAQTGWGRAAMWAAAGIVVLLAFFLILSRVPLKVNIRGGQLEVVRPTETTATVIAARATASPTVSEPTATSPPAATPTAQPTATATPSLPPTSTPTEIAPPTATATSAPVPTPMPAPFAASAISPDNAAQVTQRAVLEQMSGSQIAWSPDGQQFAIADGYDLHFYDASSLEQTRSIDPDAWLTAIAFSPDGATLAATSNGGVKLWDAISGAELHTFAGIQSAESVAFSPDGALLAVAVDQTVKLLDVASGRELYLLIQGSHDVDAVAFSPDGDTLASGALLDVKLWQVGNEEPSHTLERSSFGWRVAFSPDGAMLATDEGNVVKLWDVATGREMGSLGGHTDGVTAIAFSPDGAVLASASADLTVRLWDVASRRELRTLKGHTAEARSLAFSPDGATLASLSNDRTVRLWSVAP